MTTAKVHIMGGPKKSLHVPIEHRTPHVKKILGPGDEVGMMVDSCVSLNTIHFEFARYITKTWQHFISAIFTDSQYNCIVLSGIVQVNE